MTQEEKAKAYDEALECAKSALDCLADDYICNHLTKDDIRGMYAKLFPELGGNEDEKIRKSLSAFFAKFKADDMYDDDFSFGDILAWLEKQGGHKPQGKSALEAIKEEKVDNRNYIKTTDKVEPEFHEGDWVVYKNDVCQIVKREEGCNKLVTVFGIEKELVNERNLSTARLWTIQDAKDGDVLAYNDGSLTIFHYRLSGLDAGLYMSHVLLSDKIEFKQTCAIGNSHPATKEQRDALMKAMADAGYTFGFEKKELKKLSQQEVTKTSDQVHVHAEWHREDEQNLNACLGYIPDEFLRRWLTDAIHVKYDKPAEWSEEDDAKIVKLKSFIAQCKGFNKENRNKAFDLIDSIKPRHTWKPSEEQIAAIEYIIKKYESTTIHLYDGAAKQLYSLLEQLKQL